MNHKNMRFIGIALFIGAIFFMTLYCTSQNENVTFVKKGDVVMKVLKAKVTGNYELNLEIAGKGQIFFSADETLSKFAYLDISEDHYKIGRTIGDKTDIWKQYTGTGGSPWKIKLLKKGNFFRFWVNGKNGWIRGPLGEWNNIFEPWEAYVGVEVEKSTEISSFTLTTLPWLSQRGEPVVSRGTEGSFYEEQAIPGAILEYKDTYYMYFMAGMKGDEEGSSRRTVGVATSTDLKKWKVHPEPLISYKDYPYDNLYVNGAVLTPEGKIAVMFSAQVFPKWKGFMLATADNPFGPFKPHENNPVYKHFTHAHEFDLIEIDLPEYRYMLFYSGFTPKPASGPVGDRGYILYSNDLKHWEEHPDNPVFNPQTLDDWDAVHIRPRSITKIDDTWYLWYEGCNHWSPPDREKHHGWWDTVGLARSKDLINWEYYPRNPALPGVGISADQYDNNWVGWPRMLIKDGIAFVFYTGGAQIGLRTIPVEQLTNWKTEGGKTEDLIN